VIGLPYSAIALLYLVVLVALAAWWRASAGTMSLRQIDTMPREAFFWAATLASCALGRAILYVPSAAGGVPHARSHQDACHTVTATLMT
jgi:uncharacterized membrane-anchored protein